MKRKKNLFGFGESAKRSRQVTPASSRSFSSLPGSESHHRGKGSSSRVSTFQGFTIQRTAGGYVVPKIDSESEFEDLAQAKRFIRSYAKSNPAKFDRCVEAVKARGGAANAYAVCEAAMKKKNLAPVWEIENLQDGNWQYIGSIRAYSAKDAIAAYRREHADWSKGRKFRARARRSNPAEAAAEAFKEFHGRPSEQVVTISRKVHYHGHLAALGKLTALRGITCEGDKFDLENLGGALLCENEKRTQLFIEGGNQQVDPKDYGAAAEHEMYSLGYVKVVEYFTRKDHLGKDGGTAVYVHKFDRPYPDLIYDAVNKQLHFAGGGYSMPPEGIDN